MLRTLSLALLLAPPLLAAPVPKDFVKPVPKLNGRWQILTYESNGRPLKSATTLSQVWEFDGENLSITRSTAAGTKLSPTKVKVRADAKSGEFDYALVGGATRIGRFAIDGDTLTVVLALNVTMPERPGNLDGGTGTLKYTFKRAAEKEKDK